MDKIKNTPKSSRTWRTKFQKDLGIDVEERDIHKIFKEFGIKPYEIKRYINGKVLEGYFESDVYDIMRRGEGLKKALQVHGMPWEKGQKISKKNKKPYIQYTKPKPQPWEPEYRTVADPEDLQPKQQEYVSKLDIQPEYKNNENDMEKYSDYLIQQYQYEEYKPKKIIVTEEQFNRLINKRK